MNFKNFKRSLIILLILVIINLIPTLLIKNVNKKWKKDKAIQELIVDKYSFQKEDLNYMLEGLIRLDYQTANDSIYIAVLRLSNSMLDREFEEYQNDIKSIISKGMRINSIKDRIRSTSYATYDIMFPELPIYERYSGDFTDEVYRVYIEWSEHFYKGDERFQQESYLDSKTFGLITNYFLINKYPFIVLRSTSLFILLLILLFDIIRIIKVKRKST